MTEGEERAAGAAASHTPTGTQSIERAIAVLRCIADQGAAGSRLSQVVKRLGLAKATARRLLIVLIREGFVTQNADTRRYHLGLELYALGMAATDRLDIRSLCTPAMSRLAEDTGDTVYLSVRSGNDAICLGCVSGSYPIKTLTLSVGDRRPLGVGAGSLALLAALDDCECQAVIVANHAKACRFSPDFDAERLHQWVRETRERGYSLNPGRIIPGMAAVGVPVLNAGSRPEAALSIAAIESRMQPERQRELVALLDRERRLIESQLRGRSRSTP